MNTPMIIRPGLVQQLKTRVMLLQWPTTSLPSGGGSLGSVMAPHPLFLPDELQGFSSINLTFLMFFSGNTWSYTYNGSNYPNVYFCPKLDLWSLDENGADIQHVINALALNGVPPFYGCAAVSGSLYGQTYWAAHGGAPVTWGFRAVITASAVPQALTLINPMPLIFNAI